jgi:protease I
MRSLILTWEQFQDHEVIYPYYRLKEEGQVKLLSNAKGRIKGILGCNITSDGFLEELREHNHSYELLETTDLLVIPGGVKAMEKIRQEKNVIKFIADFAATGKTIASTCSGAQLLISAKIVQGKTISAYYAMEDDVNNAGATYSSEPVVVSGNIVTSPHYDHMAIWLKTAIDMVKNGTTTRNS